MTPSEHSEGVSTAVHVEPLSQDGELCLPLTGFPQQPWLLSCLFLIPRVGLGSSVQAQRESDWPSLVSTAQRREETGSESHMIYDWARKISVRERVNVCLGLYWEGFRN